MVAISPLNFSVLMAKQDKRCNTYALSALSSHRARIMRAQWQSGVAPEP